MKLQGPTHYGDRRLATVKIAAEIRVKILDGEYPPGMRLPSTSGLIAQFNVPNSTIQKALDILKREGLIVGRAGRGVFVLPTRLGLQNLDTGAPLIVEALDVTHERPAGDIAGQLDLAATDVAVVRSILLSRGGEPIEWQRAFYPASFADNTPLADPAPIHGGAWGVLRECGRTPAHQVVSISCRPPTGIEIEMLRLASTQIPIARLLKVARGEGGEAVEVVVIIRHGHVASELAAR